MSKVERKIDQHLTFQTLLSERIVKKEKWLKSCSNAIGIPEPFSMNDLNEVEMGAGRD